MSGVTVALTGESLITRPFPTQEEDDTAALRRLITSADLAFTHLEIVCASPPIVPRPRLHGIHVNASSRVLDDLKNWGFELVGLAHNHAMDFGGTGLIQTIAALDARGFVTAGAGPTLSEARRPRYVNAKGARASLLAACSTDADEICASDPDGLFDGRPGISPVRFTTQYEVTSDQFAFLSSLDEALGTAAGSRARHALSLVLGAPDGAHTSAATLRFLNVDFVEGTAPQVHTRPSPADLEQMARWIGEARRQSDLVIVSFHCHEGPNGTSNGNAIADFAVEAARSFIDAGADICVGHGPHQLAAIEIYHGKPIFHSLGNLVFMVETIDILPAEFLSAAGLPARSTAADFHDFREGGSDAGRRGFAHQVEYWQTVVPMCKYDDGRLVGIDLWPVALNRGTVRSRRGVPGLAPRDVGEAIVTRIASLSEGLGTSVSYTEIDGRLVGRVAL